MYFYPKDVPFLFYHLFCNNRWQNTSLQLTTSLTSCTVSFMLGFSRLCYYLVKTGNIKISAVLSTNNDTGVNTLSFPELGDVCIDMDRAETFGLMTVRAGLRNSIIKKFYHQYYESQINILYNNVYQIGWWEWWQAWMRISSFISCGVYDCTSCSHYWWFIERYENLE